MPTTITRTIGKTTAPENRDHANLAAFVSWAVANYPNLVTSDVILRAEVYQEGGGTDGEYTSTSTLSFSGLTCDATRYIEIVAAPGESFKDSAPNALRYNRANGVALKWTGNYAFSFDASGGTNVKVVLRGLQINNQSLVCTGFAATFFAYECIFETSYNAKAFTGPGAIVNSVIRCTNAAGYPFGGNDGQMAVIGCTLVGSGAAYAFNWSNYAYDNVVRNSIVVGFATAITNNSARFNTAQCSDNATDLASFGFGSANVVGITQAATFENTGAGTEDYRIKAGAAVIGAGIRDQTYTGDLDILGQSRSTTTPTIGAFEYLTPPPTAPVLSLPGVNSITATSAVPKVTLTF